MELISYHAQGSRHNTYNSDDIIMDILAPWSTILKKEYKEFQINQINFFSKF